MEYVYLFSCAHPGPHTNTGLFFSLVIMYEYANASMPYTHHILHRKLMSASLNEYANVMLSPGKGRRTGVLEPLPRTQTQFSIHIIFDAVVCACACACRCDAAQRTDSIVELRVARLKQWATFVTSWERTTKLETSQERYKNHTLREEESMAIGGRGGWREKVEHGI